MLYVYRTNSRPSQEAKTRTPFYDSSRMGTHAKKSTKAKHLQKVRILFDSGCGATLINKSFVTKLRQRKTTNTTWRTKAGSFSTTKKCTCTFMLPEFHKHRVIEWEMYVDESSSALSNYDMIIGRDLMESIGLDLLFSENLIRWDGATVPMQDISLFKEVRSNPYSELLSMHDPVTTEAERIQGILDIKYAPADLNKIVRECVHLTDSEKSILGKLLRDYQDLFDGTLGTWDTDPIELQLCPEVKPYHAKAYPVPHSQEKKLKEEIDRMCAYGVLRKVNRSEWGFPAFIIPKKDGSLRSIADLRELNKMIKRKPFPLPKIQDMLQKLEGFMYATSLDLNMGYYHIELSPNSSKYCTIVLPWGKYEYLRLPMGLSNSPDIFQEKMGDLFSALEFARAYIDDLLVISSSTFEDHMDKLAQVLTRLREAGLKVNPKVSSPEMNLST